MSRSQADEPRGKRSSSELTEGKRVEILSGLGEGDRVVEANAGSLTDGQSGRDDRAIGRPPPSRKLDFTGKTPNPPLLRRCNPLMPNNP